MRGAAEKAKREYEEEQKLANRAEMAKYYSTPTPKDEDEPASGGLPPLPPDAPVMPKDDA